MSEGTQNRAPSKILHLDLHNFEVTQNCVPSKILELDLHIVRGDPDLGPLENT